MNSITRWSPGDYLTDQAETRRPSFALVILNQPIVDIEGFTKLWNNGDLDSLQSKVGNYYRSLGVPIVPDHSQYATDFTKSLNWIARQEQLHDSSARGGEIGIGIGEEDIVSDDAEDDTNGTGKQRINWTDGGEAAPAWVEHIPLDVVAYGATGGRVDQVFHAIDQLFRASKEAREGGSGGDGDGRADDGLNTSASAAASPAAANAFRRKVTLISEASVTFLLEKGRNVIETPLELFGKTCGMIPVAGSSVITTEGLEWDLKDTETRFGGMVSTSNHLMRGRVEVSTTELLLWTMEIRRAKPVVEIIS
ncbi:hypothetical protein H072_2040 [Dactylellina haptotyla CBS 200.50]|uniref:Thiamin pyrophosphokinase thiamin-binding domain-containing protein n=1 Tax=Dactylellina haptotyla (strain CBS 200.50) TaxID=1284197 RepID=S8ASB8_DACHA|nr:hypothetical protein H072_2040 [Dactylellina haptotyla CBS 200.50]